jgi:REP element-mobilizing transposase RayT
MPRRSRLQLVGGIYHCTQHGINDFPIYRSDEDREMFLRYLGEEIARSEWDCLAYSLMRTHYHLLIRLTKETLSSGFQRLNGRYAQTFNLRYGRRGHVFERRFRDVLVESDAHRYETARYIHLNAPKVNACPRPEDYPWCDFAATMGLVARDPYVDPMKALDVFGDDLEAARRGYAVFMAERDPRVRRGYVGVRPGPDPGLRR